MSGVHLLFDAFVRQSSPDINKLALDRSDVCYPWITGPARSQCLVDESPLLFCSLVMPDEVLCCQAAAVVSGGVSSVV